MKELGHLKCDACGNSIDFSAPVTHVALQAAFLNYDSVKPAYPCCECGRLHLLYGNGVVGRCVETLTIAQERNAYLIADKIILKD